MALFRLKIVFIVIFKTKTTIVHTWLVFNVINGPRTVKGKSFLSLAVRVNLAHGNREWAHSQWTFVFGHEIKWLGRPCSLSPEFHRQDVLLPFLPWRPLTCKKTFFLAFSLYFRKVLLGMFFNHWFSSALPTEEDWNYSMRLWLY